MKMHGRFVPAGHGPHDAAIAAGVGVGISCAAIARACGVTPEYVYGRRLRLGLPVGPLGRRPVHHHHDPRLLAAAAAGQTLKQIAETLGVSPSWVSERLRRLGQPPRRKGISLPPHLTPVQIADYRLFRRKGYLAAEALNLVLREAA